MPTLPVLIPIFQSSLLSPNVFSHGSQVPLRPRASPRESCSSMVRCWTDTVGSARPVQDYTHVWFLVKADCWRRCVNRPVEPRASRKPTGKGPDHRSKRGDGQEIKSGMDNREGWFSRLAPACLSPSGNGSTVVRCVGRIGDVAAETAITCMQCRKGRNVPYHIGSHQRTEPPRRGVQRACSFPQDLRRLVGMSRIRDRRVSFTRSESGKCLRTSGARITAPSRGFTSLMIRVPSASGL